MDQTNRFTKEVARSCASLILRRHVATAGRPYTLLAMNYPACAPGRARWAGLFRQLNDGAESRRATLLQGAGREGATWRVTTPQTA